MTYTIETLKKLSKLELGANDRLCRIIAKKGMIGSRTMESQAAILPAVSANVVQQLLMKDAGKEWFCNAVEKLQDELVRNRIAAGHLSVYDNHIDAESILGLMETENSVQRFSKESIKVWFDSVLCAPLTDAIVAKMPTATPAVVNKLVGNYLESFQILAGRNPSMKAEVKAGLLRALDFVPADHESVTAIEVVRRLNEVTEATVILAAL
jgi:hypothetical protein